MSGHDLVALWEAHCRYEFESRDVEATMASMVAEPYVNHVPTMTGGVGLGLAVQGAHIGWLLVLPAAPVAGGLGYLLARRLASRL